MKNKRDSQQQKILLHACCAPCAPHVFNVLSENYDVTVFFYNPNLQPEAEYRAREEDMKRFARETGFELLIGEYDEAGWMEAVRGLEGEPEGGARCRICFRHRLGRAARETAERGFDLFTTTLTVSPHKNAKVINEEGAAAAQRFGVKFLESDFKKKDGFKISGVLSGERGFYRQDYCGCLFSRRA
jgi:predicted adenine nucleotide alpha hydrolase (AANH) superfamily ATPase